LLHYQYRRAKVRFADVIKEIDPWN
jgi:hypothetical protein